MNRTLPSHDEVRLAMDQVLHEAHTVGRKATVTMVERRLHIAHPTFYRNYRDLITEYFQPQAHPAARQPNPGTRRHTDHDDTNLQRLRTENKELRQLVQIYAETIRQLTLTNHELENKLHDAAQITTLSSRRTPP